MKQRFITIILAFALLSPWAYGQERGQVLSAEPLTPAPLSVQETQAYINNLSPLNLPDYVLNLLSDIDYAIWPLKVVYGTKDVAGNPTYASGLVVVPQAPCPVDIMVYCHGTVFDKDQVPSRLSGAGNGSELLFGLLYAGNGYLTLLPDYLGLGDSPGFHLYLDEKTQASATVDLMLAARNLATEYGIPLTQKVQISGYSQGGHAGMSAFKFLQEASDEGFQVLTAGLGSGPYSLAGVQYNYIVNDPYYARPEFVLYSIASCQASTSGNIYTGLSDVLLPPYDQWYTTDILGQTGDVSWVVIPYTDMLTEGFYNSLLQPNNPMRQCLAESDVSSWNDRLPTAMYYCTADQEVYYYNSIVTERRLESRLPWYLFWMRALINSVYLGDLNHGDCIIPYTLVSRLRFDLWQSTCTPAGVEGREPLASDKPLVSRPAYYYYADIRASATNPPERVEFLRFDGSLAAAFTGLKAQSGAVRLDVREMERGAYVLRIVDAKGNETLGLTILEPVEILRHQQYNPLSYSADNAEYHLDLSLLPEPVQSLLIYDGQQQLVREIDAKGAMGQMAFSAKGLAPATHTLEVRTAEHSYFLELEGQPRSSTASSLSVFPNPAEGYFAIRLTGDDQLASAALIDSQGRTVWSLQNLRGQQVQPALQLPSGVYLLRVVARSGKVMTERLVIR